MDPFFAIFAQFHKYGANFRLDRLAIFSTNQKIRSVFRSFVTAGFLVTQKWKLHFEIRKWNAEHNLGRKRVKLIAFQIAFEFSRAFFSGNWCL